MFQIAFRSYCILQCAKVKLKPVQLFNLAGLSTHQQEGADLFTIDFILMLFQTLLILPAI